MIINHSLPSLIGGVSQQAAVQRHPSQVEDMVNMVPSVSSGLRRRWGTQHIAQLTATPRVTGTAGPKSVAFYPEAFVHGINRGTDDDAERYLALISDGGLRIWDLFGNEKVLATPFGYAYLSNPGGVNPRDCFAAVTVADYTFIVNKFKTVAVKPATPVAITPTFYVVIKAGVAKTSYYVALDGNLYAFETTDGTGYQSAMIGASLATSINAGGLYACERQDNLLIITKVAGGDFQARVTDSYGDQAMFGFKNTVNRYEELPRKFVPGVTIEVKGDPNNADNSFYVEWHRTDANSDGVWVETIKPNIDVEFDETTLPHVLIREANGTFTFKPATWDKRLVGDDNSNPKPSFVGGKINDVFFFRNRLGFLADENVVMSQAGQYFNFWATSARAVTDADPVDVSAATTKVTFLRFALPFEKSILLFSDQQQFQLVAGDSFSAKSIRIEPTTAYAVSKSCRPVNMGRNVVFATPRGSSTSIREYYFDGNTVQNDASDTTAHVPTYIPWGVSRLTVAPTEDLLAVISSEYNSFRGEYLRDKLWIYNSYWNGEQKEQSAWHRWEFKGNPILLSADVFGTNMYLLLQYADGVYLDKLPLEEEPPIYTYYPICLDRQYVDYGGVYNSAANRTSWTLPYPLVAGAVPRVVKVGSFGSGEGLVARVDSSVTAPYGVISLPGNYTASPVVVGIEYASSVTLSQQFYVDAQMKPVAQARLTLRDITFEFADTGYFETRVATNGRSLDTFVYTAKNLGLSSMLIGRPQIESGEYKVPIQSRSDEVTITVQNQTHLPTTLLSAEWQGYAAMQAQRR
jgi:hypothetical protein